MPSLKDLRALKRLSQSELATASGVSLETIKKLERGKVEQPRAATLRLLEAVLGPVPATLYSSRASHVFDAGMVENARGGGVPVLEVVPDLRRGIRAGFVPLRQTTLTGTLDGPLASLQLKQRFAYSQADCDLALEARYRFPLPGDAAVTGVTACFGDVVIDTSLVAREEAEANYAAAKKEGRQAALTTRESADVFTLQLTGLQPDQDVVVEIRFVQLARSAPAAGWELRVPLTVGARYSRPDEAGTSAAKGQPLAIWCDPGHRFALDLAVRGATVASSTHALALSAGPDGSYHVEFEQGSVVPDRDLVLVWGPEQRVDKPVLEVLVHEDIMEGTRYFLALVTPPGDEALPGVDREITLLVDQSGSMKGSKWDACYVAAQHFLAGMRESDTFNLGLFQTTCDWFARAPLPGTDANRQGAMAFLERHAPTGGTELGPALEQALRAAPSTGDRTRHILLLTDAQVSDEGRILQLVEANAKRPDRRHLSLICIDSAPKSAFVHDLAEAGAGVAVFLSSNPDQEDLAHALDQVLETWARPLARDIQVVVESRAAAHDAPAFLGSMRSTTELGDLPAGKSLWVSGAVSLFSEPIVRLFAGATVLAEVPIDLESAPSARPAIRTLFGAHQLVRLERLEASQRDRACLDEALDALGYAGDPLRTPEPPPLYSENAARLQVSVVQKLLVRESLRFGLLCSATAFVGVRTEAGRRVDDVVIIPSALPSGWSDQLPMSNSAAARETPPPPQDSMSALELARMSIDFDDARGNFGVAIQTWGLEQLSQELQQPWYVARANGPSVALGLLAAWLESGQAEGYRRRLDIASLLTDGPLDLVTRAPLDPLLRLVEMLGLEVLQCGKAERRLLDRLIRDPEVGSSNLPLVAELAAGGGSASLRYLGNLLAEQRDPLSRVGAVITLLDDAARVWVLDGISVAFQPGSLQEVEAWLGLFNDASLGHLSSTAVLGLLRGASRAAAMSTWSESDDMLLGRISRRLLRGLR